MLPVRIIVCLLALLISGISSAAKPSQLTATYGCLGCHAVDYERAGPSFQQIAARYKSSANAVETLVRSSRLGSVKKWGDTPMPPDLAPEADVRKIVQWILEH